MRDESRRRVRLLLALIFVASCESGDHVLGPISDGREAENVAAAALRAEEAPLGLAAIDRVLEAWSQSLSCPETFALGSGGSGSCLEVQESSYYSLPYAVQILSVAATLPGGDSAAALPFELRVTPVSGSNEYLLSVSSAQASVAHGNGTWRLGGTVQSDEGGNPNNVYLTVHTSQGRWSLSDGWISIPPQGAPSVTARIQVSSGTGAIKVGASTAAAISISGGCVTIDFVDPATPDRNTCMW